MFLLFLKWGIELFAADLIIFYNQAASLLVLEIIFLIGVSFKIFRNLGQFAFLMLNHVSYLLHWGRMKLIC